MKIQLSIIILMLGFSSAFCQIGKTERLSRMERKALKSERMAAKEMEVAGMIKDTLFVLEATRIENSASDYRSVDPNLYFVALAKERVLFQLGLTDASNLSQFRGRTVEGRITKMKITESKRGKTTKISASIVTDIGRFIVDFIVSPYGQASAVIESIDRGKVTFRGTLVRPEDSSIYVGGPVF